MTTPVIKDFILSYIEKQTQTSIARAAAQQLIVNQLSGLNHIVLNAIVAVSSHFFAYILNYTDEPPKKKAWSNIAQLTLVKIVFFQVRQWATGYQLYPLKQSINTTLRVTAFYCINAFFIRAAIAISAHKTYFPIQKVPEEFRSVVSFAFVFFAHMLAFPLSYMLFKFPLTIPLFTKEAFINICYVFLSKKLIT